MSNAVSLNFLQELRALELEVSTLLTFVENPEECPELFDTLIQNIRNRVEKLVNIMIEFTIIGNSMHLSSGEGEKQQTTPGLAIVTELFVDSFLTFFIRLVTTKSDNLAVTRDLLALLYNDREVPKSDQVLPSIDSELSNFLVAIGKMREEYIKINSQGKKDVVVEASPSEETKETKETTKKESKTKEDTQADNA